MFGKKKREYSEDYYYFDDHYYDAVCRWVDRIDDVDVNNDNPDKNLAAYEKRIALAREFKAFCESKRGGREYFAKEYPDYISNLQRELEAYKKIDYPEELKWIEKENEYKELLKETCCEIKILIRKGVVLQAELKKMLSEEEQKVFDKAINELIDKGIIAKGYEGKRIKYTIAVKCPGCGAKTGAANYCRFCGFKLQ